MTTVNWENLGKNALDPTTISEAIDAKITNHNDDPEAHLGEDQALESHRAAEIIDHLAESVVNDKIASLARAYTAIVDPDSESDFDTLEAAVDYVNSLGGGNILLKEGTHYLDSDIYMLGNIDLTGVDASLTRLASTSGEYFHIYLFRDAAWTATYVINTTISRIGTDRFANGVTVEAWDDYIKINVDNCSNIIMNRSDYDNTYVAYKSCYFDAKTEANNAINIYTTENSSLRDCIFRAQSNGAYGVQLDQGGTLDNCDFKAGAYSGHNWLANGSSFGYVSSCTFLGLAANGLGSKGVGLPLYRAVFVDCAFYYGPLTSATLYGESSSFLGCYFSGTTALTLAIDGSSTDNVFIGGYVRTALTGEGTTNRVIGVEIGDSQPFTTVATSTTALALRWRDVVQLTPNSTRTLTTTIAPAGQTRQLIILTSGTTSYTLTFGTGFKTIGTLATGTTSARRFILNFISDGTYMIEVSRTAAIA